MEREGGSCSPGGGAPAAHHRGSADFPATAPQAFSLEGKSEVVAVAIAVRLVFIIIFFLGASVQETAK